MIGSCISRFREVIHQCLYENVICKNRIFWRFLIGFLHHRNRRALVQRHNQWVMGSEKTWWRWLKKIISKQQTSVRIFLKFLRYSTNIVYTYELWVGRFLLLVLYLISSDGKKYKPKYLVLGHRILNSSLRLRFF